MAKGKVLFTRDKDGSLTQGLEREIRRREESGVPITSRQALIKEVLWEAVRGWDDPRRGRQAGRQAS